MPVIKGWFNEDKNLDWAIWDVAYHYNQKSGPDYCAYPLIDVIPQVRPQAEDLESTVHPLWITEIDPSMEIGKINHRNEGTYIIDLPATFGSYLELLEYDRRKKSRYSLKKNSDLEIIYDRRADIDQVWEPYVARIQQLNLQDGAEYSAEDLQQRREFFDSSGIQTISFYAQGQLLAVNVSKSENDTVFDIACLRSDSAPADRGIGIFATLINIQRSIEENRRHYDMLSANFGYKTKFGAKEVKLRHYLRCTAEFAAAYEIDPEDISELIKE